MIKIRTKNKITLAQAKDFEDVQAEKNLLKKSVFATDDCKWQLEVSTKGFHPFQAVVNWYQIIEHPSQGEENNVETPMLIFNEVFMLDEQETEDMFQAVGISIIAGTDSLQTKLNEIVTAGVFHWIGNIRNIFGIGTAGFETV